MAGAWRCNPQRDRPGSAEPLKDLMAHITLTLSDADGYRVRVATDADTPAVGRPLTPAESLALDLIAAAARQRADVQYDAGSIPLVALALDLISPDGYGWQLPPELHARIKAVLGPRMAQIAHPKRAGAPADGIDIDAMHRTRGAA